ncbi:MAG TPA: protein translocase subunit SecD, partial [Candidatus Paceibacterota bacterium]|nr:protein translocase subunit SecD [Candidatus Paceibacterota bacterium]
MTKIRFWAIALILAGVLIGYFNYYSEINPQWGFYRPFRLGLDLSGGSRLIYEADVSKLNPADVADAMSSLREVIERRVNVFGVSEPLVQTESSAMSGTVQNRLIVELPGVTDVKEAAKMISATPQLEFMIEGATSTP